MLWLVSSGDALLWSGIGAGGIWRSAGVEEELGLGVDSGGGTLRWIGARADSLTLGGIDDLLGVGVLEGISLCLVSDEDGMLRLVTSGVGGSWLSEDNGRELEFTEGDEAEMLRLVIMGGGER